MAKYRVWLINFHCFLEEEKNTLQEAIEYGKEKGYNFSVYKQDEETLNFTILEGSSYGCSNSWIEY